MTIPQTSSCDSPVIWITSSNQNCCTSGSKLETVDMGESAKRPRKTPWVSQREKCDQGWIRLVPFLDLKWHKSKTLCMFQAAIWRNRPVKWLWIESLFAHKFRFQMESLPSNIILRSAPRYYRSIWPTCPSPLWPQWKCINYKLYYIQLLCLHNNSLTTLLGPSTGSSLVPKHIPSKRQASTRHLVLARWHSSVPAANLDE